MFKTMNLYRVGGNQALTSIEIEHFASLATFTPCGPTQDKSVGWVPPRGEAHGVLVENPVAGHYILKLMIETKIVPGATVRAKAQEAADHIEATTGRKPGKKETKELREDALLALLPQAFAKQTAVWVWIDVAAGTLVHDASSQSKADQVITALVRTFDGLQLTAVQTKLTPGAAMTRWLTCESDQWPEDFYVERECELKGCDEEKSVVKFARHNLATDEVRKHITEGKLPTRLAMSYAGRLSFVLTEQLMVKKLAFLETALYDRDSDSEGDAFDADVALSTGELAPFIKALVAALDGEPQADLFGGE